MTDRLSLTPTGSWARDTRLSEAACAAIRVSAARGAHPLRRYWRGPAGIFPPGPQSYQPAYKPGSVWPAWLDARVTAIPLRRRLPGAFSDLPGRRDSDTDPGDCSLLAQKADPVPSLFGLAPGGVCPAACVAAGAVRSYRTVSPLPLPAFVRASGRAAGGGGLFSVALSLGSRPPDVIRHRMSMEPGLSSRTCLSTVVQAAVQPTDHIGMGCE